MIDSFDVLLEKLLTAPSAPELFPIPGQVLGRPDVITPKIRLLVALWYLATQDTLRSIALM